MRFSIRLAIATFLCLHLPALVFAQSSTDVGRFLPIIHNLLDDTEREVEVDAVFFAQTHVQQANQPYFTLVGNRETLIKAHVVGPPNTPSPVVEAILSLDGQTLRVPMTGPAVLPLFINIQPGQVQHSSHNSFIAEIPKQWVRPGLTVSVVTLDKTLALGMIKVGAPTEVLMTMFDVHYFALTPGDYPNGWQQELEAKWPVANLELRRIPDIVFDELIIPARPDVGAPVVKVSSREDYRDQTGLNFDGEQGAASQWAGALKRASGIRGRTSLYYVNIYGVASGGQAGGFAGVGNGKSVGILNHELGHALSLPHWTNNNGFPYVGDSLGITAPNTLNGVGVHAGPTWAFDLPSRTFIPPTVQANNVGGRLGGHPVVVGTYKASPMQGGGTGDQEQGFVMRHFSDFSVNRMRNYLEGHVLAWNETLNRFASWNQTTSSYSRTVTNNGVDYPVQRNVNVVSVMAAVSPASNVSHVYPPVGPYVSNIIDLFDPENSEDRAQADAIFCPGEGCDVSLRVTQGGVQKTYMLAASWDATVSPLSSAALSTQAINLPVSAGMVTRVQLLLTPDAEVNGVPDTLTLLAEWVAP